MITPRERELWESFVYAYQYSATPPDVLKQLVQAFLQQEDIDQIAILREGVAKNWLSFLRVVRDLSIEQRQQLFPELVELALTLHGGVLEVRAAIYSIPREWVMERIELEVDRVLAQPLSEDSEYRRALEFYRDIDEGLTRKLAQRAQQHPDPYIQEAGNDFIEWLDEK